MSELARLDGVLGETRSLRLGIAALNLPWIIFLHGFPDRLTSVQNPNLYMCVNINLLGMPTHALHTGPKSFYPTIHLFYWATVRSCTEGTT